MKKRSRRKSSEMKCFRFGIVAVTMLLFDVHVRAAKNDKNAVVVDNIADVKDFKKLLRTKTNVLVCFLKSPKESTHIVRAFKEAAVTVKGLGTMVLVDCSGEAKKMCKKLKVSPEPHLLRHYKDGEFNKDYDRKETTNSLVNFMRDPTGDLPWEEDATATDVMHVSDAASLAKFIKKESKPVMVMFYAPWCSFCKSLKPEYAAAAVELQGQAVLAAIDVNRPENAVIRSQYNITGFPTLLYFQNGLLKFQYEGDNNRPAIVSFMRNPQLPPPKIKEPEWSDVDSEVVHLTASSFEPVIKEEASALVMFYAPWCGHCKRMKPEYERAAALMKVEGVAGMLAAVEATKEQALATKYDVKGYPSIKYFAYGEAKFDVNVREAQKIFEFMQNPKEPPPPPPPEKPWSEERSEVVHLNEETFRVFLKKKKHVLVMFYAPWCGHCKKAKPEFAGAAERFKDDPKVEFAAVDCTTQQALCSSNDVKGYPTIKYFSYYTKNIRPYTGGRTENDFVNFMLDPENLNIGVQPMQAAKEESFSAKTNVIHLTDNTFKDFIASHKHVLVMFHAPWCGHCKRLKPIFVKVAEELEAEGFDGKLVMFDCIENQIVTDEYEISGFPTLKLFKEGKYVSDYRGNRSREDLKNFLRGGGSAQKMKNKKDEL